MLGGVPALHAEIRRGTAFARSRDRSARCCHAGDPFDAERSFLANWDDGVHESASHPRLQERSGIRPLSEDGP